MTHVAPLRWRKSTRSGSESNCVEVQEGFGRVRDSKNASGPSLEFAAGVVAEFLAAAKNGELDNN